MKRNERKSWVKAQRLTITLGGGQRRKIEAIAKGRRTSAATVIRWAVDEYIGASAVGLRRRSKSK